MEKTILIVDNDRVLINVMSKKIRNSGFTVIEASNGEEGLKKAKKYHPDMILLDIIMPVMDGMTMLRLLRKDDWGRKAKVIMLTNLADEAEIAIENNLDLSEYLIKSDWSLADIVKKIKEKIK